MDAEERSKMEFPSNSIKSRVRTMDVVEVKTPEVKKIITGKVTKKKKTFTESVTSVIFSEDVKNVGAYILYDVMIPALKDTIIDMIKQGADMAFYGQASKNSNIRRDKTRSYVSYNTMSREPERGRREVPDRARNQHNFDEIVIDTRAEAEEVLDTLVDMIDRYQEVTVGSYYDMLGMRSDFTDQKYGWTNLGQASIMRVREGYVISLPRPKPLD